MSAAAYGHKPSDSYLMLRAAGATVQGQCDIALWDLDFAIGLDANDDGQITWGELRSRHEAIAAYALPRPRIAGGGEPCPAKLTGHLVDNHSDGAYAVLRFVVECASPPEAINVKYGLFFDLDCRGPTPLSSAWWPWWGSTPGWKQGSSPS